MHRYRYATGDVCSSIQGAKSKLQQRVARGKDTIGKWAKNHRAVAEIIANNLEHILHRDPTRKKKRTRTDWRSLFGLFVCHLPTAKIGKDSQEQIEEVDLPAP